MIIYVVEDYGTREGLNSIWSSLDSALDRLRSRPHVDAGEADFDDPFSTVDLYVWNNSTDRYTLDYEKFPSIYYRPLLNKFYTHFGTKAWYFDSATEYRMKAAGALTDD